MVLLNPDGELGSGCLELLTYQVIIPCNMKYRSYMNK